jgi:hypothetical protein
LQPNHRDTPENDRNLDTSDLSINVLLDAILYRPTGVMSGQPVERRLTLGVVLDGRRVPIPSCAQWTVDTRVWRVGISVIFGVSR